MMTGRQRILAILNNEPTDRLAWTVLADAATRSGMPENIREMGQLGFYRLIGCDVLMLGCYGVSELSDIVTPCVSKSPNVRDDYLSMDDGTFRWERDTDWGKLTTVFRNGHPVKYPVESVDDLRVLKQLWLSCHYEEQPDAAESYARIFSALGDIGVYADAVPPSPVQQLIESDMGLATFYYLLDDYRREVEELLDIMHARRLEEYDIIARCSRADLVMPIENTSSMLTSPAVYAKYSLPQIRDYVSVLHSHGKKAILHMCGHLKHLLNEIRKTGLDGINSLTPPPVGDTHFEEALDAFGEEFIILGGIIPPDVFQKPELTFGELDNTMRSIYTMRIRSANFLLCAGADGLPTSMERFQMLKDWFVEDERSFHLPAGVESL